MNNDLKIIGDLIISDINSKREKTEAEKRDEEYRRMEAQARMIADAQANANPTLVRTIRKIFYGR